MRTKRTKWLKTGVPIFLAGAFLVGGCSLGAGEPIQEINADEAQELEDGFVYIHYDKEAEEIYLDQLKKSFDETGESLSVLNFYEYAEEDNARVTDFGLNNQRYALAYYSNGELVDQIKMEELNNEIDPEVINRALIDFIEFNQ